MAIRNYCSDDSIIVDGDLNGVLIGNQVFKIANSIFQETNKWFLHSGEFWKNADSTYQYNREQNVKRENFRYNLWNATGLRMYSKKLFMKIPIDYFLATEGEYLNSRSDKFVTYALAELAEKHLHYIPHFLYFDYKNENLQQCAEAKKMLDEEEARAQVPLKALE